MGTLFSASHPAFICSKSTMETPEQCVNYVQSYQDFKHYFDVSIYFEHVNAGWVLAIGLNVLVPLKRFIIYKYDRHFL